MKIGQIYQQYKIPPNLQLHMIRVASVGAFIVDHWKEDKLDRIAIVQALLLHDTGNIIKFDFKYSHLMGREEKNIGYWKKVQQEFKEKYGDDEHLATLEIAKEIGLEDKTFELLNAIGSSKLQQALETEDWNKKIVCYSDFRVDPHGIVTVDKRFDEIVSRYKGRQHELGNINETEKRRLFCLELQKQLQTMVNFDLDILANNNIQKYLDSVSGFEIPSTRFTRSGNIGVSS